MFGLGTVLQAEVAATAPAADALRVRLLVRLARSQRWLVGAVATRVGGAPPPAAGGGAPATAAAWLVATALASAVGGIDELSALRTAGPSTVAPLVLATETLIPVALAPALFGETWPESAAHRLGLAIGIGAVAGGAVVLGRARGYAAVVEEAHGP